MKPAPPRPLDTLLGWVFWCSWRLVGLVLWPVMALRPRLRRHVWQVPHPVPGWTWIHGASRGEHRVVEALATQVPQLWRTSSSPRTAVPGAFPAPADLPFVIGPWLDHARPGRLVLVESELWPGWLVACRRRGIPVVVVQARPSRGWDRWARLGPVWRWLMADVVVIPQEEVGDLKVEAPVGAPSGHLPLKGEDSASATSPPRAGGGGPNTLPPNTILLASSRPGDEARVLAAWSLLPAPRPPLAIAPRHLTRLPEVEALLQRRPFDRWSTGARSHDIVLIDTFGELAALHRSARLAIVGGTFDPTLGGHSPSEATAAGIAVVAGPHRHANPAAWSAATVLDAPDAPEALARVLQEGLRQPPPGPPPSGAVARVVSRLPTPSPPPPRATRPLLWPLVPVVHTIGRLRPAHIERPVRVSVPVISVGGLTAGGTGKTPLAGWLAAHIPGAWVVARGHRRPSKGPAVRVGHPGQPPAHALGDELEMLRRRGIPVVSAPHRLAGARAAIAQGARCIILDDGFSHRRLYRDVDIVCLDARWPRGGGPIPVGTQREPWRALQRAHVIVVFGSPIPPGLPDRPLVHASISLAPTALPHTVPIALGIARPAGVLCSLIARGHTLHPVHLVPDHGTLPPLPPGCVVTEKDAARLPQNAHVHVIHATLSIPDPRPLAAVLQQAGVTLIPPSG